jgi:hypothetical protein
MTTFETTPEQRQQLSKEGFSLLPGALPFDLLTRWQRIAKRLEMEALDAHARNESRHGACVIEDPAGPRLIRQDDILGEHIDAVLDLLACPAMMAIAREMCGRGVVPLQADILYKHQHPHPVIKWHQGAPHPRGYPYLNVGIYLDDANANDGCLRYVPGTQDAIQDICEMSRAGGWEIPGVVEQPARAGDILVQDMMVLHGSPPKRSSGVRRTIYVELRPSSGIVESEAQSEEWKKLRERWMGLVVRRADAVDWPEAWQNDLPHNLGSDENEIAAILSHWNPPIPAVYCPHEIPHDVETDVYPIPADLRG